MTAATFAEESGIERALRALMLTCVGVSTVCLLAGLALWLFRGDDGWGPVLLTTGLLVLMCTPVLRVVLSAVEAIRQRDWLYFWTIAGVAVLLALAVTVARSH